MRARAGGGVLAVGVGVWYSGCAGRWTARGVAALTAQATLIYLHTAKDRAIADALGEIVREGLKSQDDDGDDPPFVGGKIN